MRASRRVILIIVLVLAAIAVIAALTWINYRYVLQSQEINDFLPRWKGIRIFMTQGASPYSVQTNREIQILAYGREALQGENQLQFDYPFYALLVYAPFSLIKDYAFARAVWMTFLEVSLLLTAIIGLSLTNKRVPKFITALILTFSLVWFFSIQAVLDANISILVALAVALSFLAIRSELDALAGFMLALASIKPQIVILLVIFVMIWAISKRRWLILWSYIGTSVILIAAATLLMPDWPLQFLKQLLPYFEEIKFSNPGIIFSKWLPGIGTQLGWILSILMAILLIIEWRAALGKGYRWFLWTSYLTLVITILAGIPSMTHYFVVLLPVVILVFTLVSSRWGWLGWLFMALGLLILLLGPWSLYLIDQSEEISRIMNPSIFMIVPMFVLFGLYWVRWWAVNKKNLLLQEIAERLAD